MPEFSFLDARGVGELERLPLGEAAAALAAGDALAATWRPGPNTDGTVHESSADVLVRGRQLLSLLETQYVGDSVVSSQGGSRAQSSDAGMCCRACLFLQAGRAAGFHPSHASCWAGRASKLCPLNLIKTAPPSSRYDRSLFLRTATTYPSFRWGPRGALRRGVGSFLGMRVLRGD